MRKYETVIVIRPGLSQEDTDKVVDSAENVITSNGGSLLYREVWGKKRLAYKVDKYTEGVYVQVNFEAEGDLIPRLDNYYGLSEDIIRDLTLCADDFVVPVEEEPVEEPPEEASTEPEETPEPVAVAVETENSVEEAVEVESGTEEPANEE
ncbi:30S ribosomal protein S6 [Candidatus Hydrogenedentota bacterium]